jgi:TldD protein
MGTTYIEPGNKSFKNMLDELQDGLYVIDTVSGETSGENFTFHPQYGYIVENGKIKNMVRDINISGNLYKTLKNIKAVGDKLKLKEFGECGKGQINPRSCQGGPHLLINNLVVGGK